MKDELSNTSETDIALLVHYSGWVQGVGFRATTASMGRRYPIAGYVKNLDDGRVELYVEGKPEAVSTFLVAVRSYWMRYISDEQIQERTPAGQYQRFGLAR